MIRQLVIDQRRRASRAAVVLARHHRSVCHRVSFREPHSCGSSSGHVTYTAGRTRPRGCAVLPGIGLLATVDGVTSTIVIGVTTKTGSAVAVALSGTPATPHFAGRREIALVRPG